MIDPLESPVPQRLRRKWNQYKTPAPAVASEQRLVEARNLGISVEDGAQCGLEWTEPLLEVPPVVHPLPVDGLADLFGARRPHRPFIFEEPEAAFLEWEPAEVEQAPYLGLGVID